MGKQLQNYSPERQHLTPDLDTGHTQHVLVQLSATPGTVTTVVVPTWAKYIRIYPLSGYVFYAADENPVNGSANTGAAIVSSDLSVGDVAIAGILDARLPAPGVSKIHLSGTGANAQVYVSFSAGALTVR